MENTTLTYTLKRTNAQQSTAQDKQLLLDCHTGLSETGLLKINDHLFLEFPSDGTKQCDTVN